MVLNPAHSQLMNQRANMAIKVGKEGITFLGIKCHRNETLESFADFSISAIRFLVSGFSILEITLKKMGIGICIFWKGYKRFAKTNILTFAEV